MKEVVKMLKIPCMILAMFLLLSFSNNTAYAKESIGQCGDSLYWSLDDGVMTITGTEKMWDFRNDFETYDYHECPWSERKDEIKEIIFENGITYIGADAFEGCTSLEKVTFSNTITYIGNLSFANCTGLENFILPTSLERLGQEAFRDCVSITKVVIPDNVTYLDSAIFGNCTALTDVYIGGSKDAVSYVSANCIFRNCTALEEIKVSPDNLGLESIDGILYIKGEGTLSQYPAGKKDKKVVLPEGTKYILRFGIENVVNMEELVFPESLELLDISAITNCPRLKHLTIPANVRFWDSVKAEYVDGEDIATNCWNLEYLENLSSSQLQLTNTLGIIWTDKNGNPITTITTGQRAELRGCAIGVELDDEIQLSIGDSIVIPQKIIYAVDSVVANKRDLIFVSSNPKVASVDESGKVVAKGNGIAEITIKNRYKSGMGGDFTTTCLIVVDNPNESIEKAKVKLSATNYTYNGKAKKPTVTVKLGKKTLKKNTDYSVTYKNNKNIGTATVIIKGKGNYTGTVKATFKINVKKKTTFTSGNYKYKVTGSSTVAFMGLNNTKLKKVVVADKVTYGGKSFKVTSIESGILKNNTKVTSVKIGKYVKTINNSAFEGCRKLSKVTLGASVTRIGAKTFKNCIALKSIILPSKVKEIGKQAFYGTKNLKMVVIKSSQLTDIGKESFKGINSKAKIKVPEKKYKAYKKSLKNKGQGKKVSIVKY